MTNQRKTERVKAMTFAEVYDLQDHILLGFLGDLTLLGAMAVGEKAVGTDRDITLEIEFRGLVEVPGGRLTIPAHVAWCRREEESAYLHTGFKFLELTEQNRQTIEMLVTRYKFSSKIPTETWTHNQNKSSHA